MGRACDHQSSANTESSALASFSAAVAAVAAAGAGSAAGVSPFGSRGPATGLGLGSPAPRGRVGNVERGDCRAGSTPEFASVASSVASTASAAVVVDVADESFGCDPGAAVSPVDALDLSVVGGLDAAPLAGA